MTSKVAGVLTGLLSRLTSRITRGEFDPNRSLWERGTWHLQRARLKAVPAPAQEAQIALDLLEEWYRGWVRQLPPDEVTTLIRRAGKEVWIMEAALRAGMFDRAVELANSVMSLEQELSAKWPRHVPDSGIHYANITLGHAALQSGDIQEAERLLLASADVPGRSPALSTYGPDLELAEELLERGSSRTVIEYLESWRNRWRVGRELLDWWIAQIVAGRAARVNKRKYLKTRRLSDFVPGLRSILR